MEKVFKEIPVDQVDGPEKPVRAKMNMQALEELANSIRQRGILNPIEVYPTDDDRYSVVHGDRRYLAAKRAGLTLLPCIVTEEEMNEVLMDRMHENLYREDLSPIEEGIYFAYLQNNQAKTAEDIAKMIGKSKSYIEQRLWTRNWSDDIKQKLDTGQINFAQARELAGIKDEAQQKKYSEYATHDGATARTIHGWREKANKERERTKPPPKKPPSKRKPGEKPQEEVRQTLCDLCGQLHPYDECQHLHVCSTCWDIMMNAVDGNQ